VTSSAPGALVLIVDDNDKNLKLARDVLQLAGFRTIEARNGSEALTLAAEHVPDVILLDLRLPDMDGADVARELGDATRTRAIPIVALSALRLSMSAGELRAAGFAGYLEKPIDVAAFAGEVQRYCARDASMPPRGMRAY
jgi:two-component system cell cycle response regulator DivK